VRYLGPSFGGINLEDIKAPECFIIEQRLRELLDIPVFHDDQHGTAIIAAAGLLNALHLTGASSRTSRWWSTAPAPRRSPASSCSRRWACRTTTPSSCDTKGVIYQGRSEGMNQWKSAHAVRDQGAHAGRGDEGRRRLLRPLGQGRGRRRRWCGDGAAADLFAMANPDPEITPEEVKAVRQDAIVATGRSDYPNQVNNVLGFPYIFRGALDVRASTINDAMKIAAAEALAALAREDVPDEVDAAYAGRRLRYGPDYIIPVPFDPRLIAAVPLGGGQGGDGQRRRPPADLRHGGYRVQLAARLDPTAAALRAHLRAGARESAPRRLRRGRGGEDRSAPRSPSATRLRHARADRPRGADRQTMRGGRLAATGSRSTMPGCRRDNKRYTDFLYQRLQRKGALYRDCQRMVNQNRNVFAACMVALRRRRRDGHRADAQLRRGSTTSAASSTRGPAAGCSAHSICARGRTVLHRRHHGARAAEPRGARRHRRAERAARRASSATSRASRSCPSRISATRCASRRAHPRGGGAARPAQVDFEYDGEMRPMSRSTHS
jgi:malate dehydrogenase (oxaloacetate-decarboxylating)(NADP+)